MSAFQIHRQPRSRAFRHGLTNPVRTNRRLRVFREKKPGDLFTALPIDEPRP
jgi:hypothetical protein